MQDIECLGVYTSGGDAPGMNACLRAVVRTAVANDIAVMGIRRGYEGMIEADFVEMERRSVSNILQSGGTILKSARSEAFRTEEGRRVAANNLRENAIDALVAIGGDGTFRGASKLYDEHGLGVVGCPGTIDNDLYGTDQTIGYDTALNTAIDNIDRIRDTADAHNRLFLVEVMGRDAGFIALNSGIGGGAELILIPETITEMDMVKERILSLMTAQRRSTIVVVAEGDELGGAQGIERALRDDEAFSDIELRSTILGHTQRGGAPTASDRVLASRLGVAAVESLMDGHSDVMVGMTNNEIKLTPLRNVYGRRKSIDYDLLKLTQILS
ncbi:6-phosphofructokinase [Salinibacter ruber]|uniref:ATP-dependent 6-phosphofructokinase n=1 Tax=Salinibacter ruber TaxID=146919 RepID=A0A9X2U926_9BACT|nr:6-phosphofructokinase [Salinibacter ruber]MCS3657244.1 6-phosphofructokinase 1 [Salinibacter ruber]MCS3952215.1 6-phosphofructokinase 1 [Salinibacter ruber]MCS4118664.1 6-phosphofructokinase 1 [Salinibacter ruber]MCS4154847.1 6-phosphofructokinase 1 [Salinibacter ruber]MCS4170919.1 6-phosphofructokinase 1 [Salinibacter ruber]